MGIDLLAFRAMMEQFIAAQEQTPPPTVPRLHVHDRDDLTRPA
jgi:hypothetical protein